MASSSESGPLEAEIREKGYVRLHHLDVGVTMIKLGFRPVLSLDGVALLKAIVEDMAIQTIASNLLGRCKLGQWMHCRQWDAPEGFRKGGKTAGLGDLLVLAVVPDSRLILYQGSHLVDPPLSTAVSRGLPQPAIPLEELGCLGDTQDFPRGGVIILDSRLYRKIVRGHTIYHTLTKPESQWITPDPQDGPEDLKRELESIESSIEIPRFLN